MSQQEDMVRLWTITLISVLHGLLMASIEMERAGETKRIIEVSMEVMRGMTASYTPEAKGLLAKQLALLSGLVNRVEP